MENNNKIERQTNDNNNVTAILAYVFPLGWLISYLALYKDNKNEFTSFHIKQGLGVQILSVISFLFSMGFGILDFIPFNGLMGWLLKIFALFLMVVGAVGAANKEMKLLPIVGKIFQDTFKGLK